MEIDGKHEESMDMQNIEFPVDIIDTDKILQGEIVTIDDDFAYVNVGIKTDGRINLNEFNKTPSIGDVVEVLLVNKRLIDGMYVFSKTAAEKEKTWAKFLEKYKEEDMTEIEGRLESKTAKGVIVNCGNVTGFVPFFQLGDIRLKKDEEPKGTYIFKIKNIDEKRRTIFLSRKELLEEKNRVLWDNLAAKYAVGDRVQGKVLKFVEFGAFIEVDGVEGLLHKNDMSWKKVFKPKKLFKVGDEREFVILNIIRDEGKLSLGLKQLAEDPWLSIEQKYSIGTKVSGEVVTLTSYGAFVEIEDGVEGFVDSSNISWTKKNVNPNDVFEKGQKIDVQVLDINKEARKLALGYKQIQVNPWDTIGQRFNVGGTYKGKIKKITGFGMFVELEPEIDGLVHVSDVSWDENTKEPMKNYKNGDELEFKILDINKDEMKIACGIKQLTKSPWALIKAKYPTGTKVTGTVSGLVPFGMFIKLEDNIEGLVHISEVSRERLEKLDDHFKIGDQVKAEVLGVDVDKKRLSLSIKKYNAMVEKEEIKKVLNESASRKVTLGDFVKLKLEE